MALNCVGIFCEDIREELSGTHTIIGVMPDNINLAGPRKQDPGEQLIFPKMGVYLRVNLETAHRPEGSVSAKAIFPGMADVALGEISSDAIEKAFAVATANKVPLVGLIFKAVLSPLQFSEPGLASLIATVEGKELLAASLNIQIPPI